MKIALLGANGQLGRDLQRALEDHDVKPLTRNQLDVMDHERVRSVLMDLRPEVVLNTTAYHRVDDCETQAAQAYSVNALAVLNLARLANELDAVRVHVSTDYVFDGKVREPYRSRRATFKGRKAGSFMMERQIHQMALVTTSLSIDLERAVEGLMHPISFLCIRRKPPAVPFFIMCFQPGIPTR